MLFKSFFGHWLIQLMLALCALALIFQIVELVDESLRWGVNKIRGK